MSAIVSKGMSYSPDVSDHTIITCQRRLSGEKPKGPASKQARGSALDCKRAAEEAKGASGNNTPRVFKTSVFSPMGLLRRLGDKMATAFRFVFMRKKKEKRLSTRAASSGKSKKFIALDDSHRSEAIADCIEFINSSALNRSSSVSANTR